MAKKIKKKKSLIEKYIDFNINLAKRPSKKAFWFGVTMRKKFNIILKTLKDIPIYISIGLDVISITFIFIVVATLLLNNTIITFYKWGYFIIGLHTIILLYSFLQDRLKYLIKNQKL